MTTRLRISHTLPLVLALGALLAGCNSSSQDASEADSGVAVTSADGSVHVLAAKGRALGKTTNSSGSTGSGSNSPPATNLGTPVTTTSPVSPPTIAGVPISTVVAGAPYSFTPSVSSAGGTLTFSIQNPPSWASFNTATGQLSGTPAATNVGTYANIIISVNNGSGTGALAAFTITVSGAATGSANLSWVPPTQYTDGTPLTDLAGFHVYYGTSPNAMTHSVDVPNSAATSYVLGSLNVGSTYYFAVTAYDSNHVESSPSTVTNKAI
jgi:hypothetical protein